MPVVAPSVFVAHTVMALLIASVPVMVWFRLRRRSGLVWRGTGVGAAVLVVFALVLERTLHLYLLQLNPATVYWLRMSVLFAIHGALMAGVFEQNGCWVDLRFLVRKPGDAATSVAYVFGHTGIETWLVGAALRAQMVIFGLVANCGEPESCLAASDAFIMVGTTHAILAQLSPWLALGAMSERVVAALIQFILTLVVWRAVRQRRFVIVMLAVLLHTLTGLLATLYQAHVLSPVVTEAIYAVAAVLPATICWPPQGGRKIGEPSLR